MYFYKPNIIYKNVYFQKMCINFQECIKYLVGKGADPDITNDEGKTPRSLVPLEKRGMLDLGSSSPIKLSAVMELTTGK